MRRWVTILCCVVVLFGAGLEARSRRYPRSRAVTTEFKRMTGYPHGRPGYVIDHVVPLACGGADAVGNLQWQSIADAKAKDKVERLHCHPSRTGRPSKSSRRFR